MNALPLLLLAEPAVLLGSTSRLFSWPRCLNPTGQNWLSRSIGYSRNPTAVPQPIALLPSHDALLQRAHFKQRYPCVGYLCSPTGGGILTGEGIPTATISNHYPEVASALVTTVDNHTFLLEYDAQLCLGERQPLVVHTCDWLPNLKGHNTELHEESRKTQTTGKPLRSAGGLTIGCLLPCRSTVGQAADSVPE